MLNHIEKNTQPRQQNHEGGPGHPIQKLLLTLAAAATLVGVVGCVSPTRDRTAGRIIDDKAVTAKVKQALAAEPVYKYEDVHVTTYNGVVQLSGWAMIDEQRAHAGRIATRTEGVYDVVNNISIKELPSGRETGYAFRDGTNNAAYRSERNNGVYSDRDNDAYRRDRNTAYRSDTNPDADNTRRNVRDRDDATLTPGDQGNTSADLEITRRIRKALVNDARYSTTAKNIKIITIDGKVTLRGPVHTGAEKSGIVALAKNVGGEANVDDQLEVKTSP